LDTDGTPVTGATVTILGFPHARGEERIRIELRETEAGLYSARTAMVRPGLWELRLSALRGPDLFTSTILHTTRSAP
jgi:nitrogen fixation protein FixH